MRPEWITIDKRVEAAAAASAQAAGEMARTGEEVACPLDSFRDVSTRSAFSEIVEYADGAWAEALATWVAHLTIERVTWVDRARLDAAWVKPPAPRSAREVRHAPRDILHTILAESTKSGRSAAAAAELVDQGVTADAARMLAERRAEAVRRLDPPASGGSTEPVGDPRRLPPSGADGEVASTVRETAEQFLDRTEAMFEPRGSDWVAVVPDLLAVDATEGWPASLTMRWVTGLFAGTPWLEGVRLGAVALPRARGAMSFALALARLGSAVAVADVSRTAPFVLRQPVVDVRGPRRGVELASLIADRSFSTTALGLSKHRAADQVRTVGRAMLLDARLRAARVQLDGVLQANTDDRATAFEGWTRRAWGVPLPAQIAGILPRLGPADELAWVGFLLGLADRRRDVRAFDEDWFRNPAAFRAIKERDASLPDARGGRAVVLPGELSASLDEAIAFFEETLA